MRGDAEDTANHRTHDIATATDAVFGLHDRQSAHVLVDHRIVIASLADALADAARDRARRPITPLRHRALAACTHAHTLNTRRRQKNPGQRQSKKRCQVCHKVVQRHVQGVLRLAVKEFRQELIRR